MQLKTRSILGQGVRNLHPYHPDFPAQCMSIAQGAQCPATIPPIIYGNHQLGLPGHVAVPLHKAGWGIFPTHDFDSITGLQQRMKLLAPGF